MRPRLATIPLVAAIACSGPRTSTPAAPAPGPLAPAPIGAVIARPAPAMPGVKVTLADVGLESGSLDHTVDPCVDFYQFACGGWLAQNPIPPDRSSWGRGAEIDEKNTVALEALLEKASKGSGADATTRKLGDYYAACMDEAAIEKAGPAALKALLARTTKVKDPKSWMTAVTALHKLGVAVVWSEGTLADFKDSKTHVLYLDGAALGLPDRDYYVKPELADKVAAYKVHIGRLLALAGLPAASADDVLAIEVELAKLTRTSVPQRDLLALYNPTDLKGLGKQVKSVDWKALWKALAIEPSKRVIVTTPNYFAAIDKLRGRFKPVQWSRYFTYHLLQRFAFTLPKTFDDEAFELDKLTRGVETRPARSKRCIEATQDGLGDLLGQRYVASYFSGSRRQTAAMLVDALVRVMNDEIAKLAWMSEGTRQIAQTKLARLVRMIGYPDTWKTYDFDVKREDFAGNRQRSAAFEVHRLLVRAGKPVDRADWQMNAYTVDAYYEPTANTTALPAGILQPPLFGQDRSIAANLGGIGTVIGHELIHGFDDQGAHFDADGNLENWWSKDDSTRFADEGRCVAEMYSSFEAMPKGYINGRLTLGENIADLGGVKLAFEAYRSLRKDAAKSYVADGFTEDQQFFIAVGQGSCAKLRPAELQRRLLSDVHSPPNFRVYGSLRNLPEFAEAFSCAAGTPMHPARSCSVW